MEYIDQIFGPTEYLARDMPDGRHFELLNMVINYVARIEKKKKKTEGAETPWSK